MSETRPSNNRWLIILVVFLAISSVVQTALLIGQHTKSKSQDKLSVESTSRNIARQTATPFKSSARQRVLPYTFSSGSQSNDPWEEFDSMSRRINSLMRHAFTFGSPLIAGFSPDSNLNFTPAIDIEETENAYLVKSDLPGLEKDKISISVARGMLTIEGMRETSSEKRNDDTGFYAQERSYGSFYRSVPLPGPVDEANIKADYKNGVLVITLPKSKVSETPQKVVID
ncbi:MAG: Spore protein SP21 [Candidatus Omnitrophica bacterium ADurb.Bin292]|jgi:HSP20 family protein|nr:MAG: Spore protein SP21 [Candidatus Omnitrophica bacterium ADurb.Bin292]HPW76799.1 Hsp20/alpha crystallin family protein [Candidatus Omnitrophota bacterium]HQB11634.1 Hsp20/alpha crystallin family protein [Candidatus Omnitrophota bacterium]